MSSPKNQVKFVNRAQRDFFPTLRGRVQAHFTEKGISPYANRTMILKTVALMALYILPYAALSLQPAWWAALLLWTAMGVAVAGIGMSVMHDANHGAYSSKAWVNRWLSYSLNLVGGSVTNWKLQHNLLHHTYTNITHLDDDIADKWVLRFSPHTRVKAVHRWQWLYAFLFYGLSTLYWVTAKDFAQYARYTRSGINAQSARQNRLFLLQLVLIKLFYFGAILVVPVALFGLPVWVTVVGFLWMHFVAGNILTIIFQLAHTVDETAHPLPNDHGEIGSAWAVHQMETTVNFSPRNQWLSWYVGGLNFQVEHHLFPRICHVHYPEIAPIVRATAEEFGVPYLENPTFASAFRSHVRALHRFGRTPSLTEAIV